MNVPPTTPSKDASADAPPPSTLSRIRNQTLDQDDFLKLLVTQMTSQDPLSPKQDTEFIAQMTQFSALEQAKAMQTDIAKMRAEQAVLQANGLLGRAVQIETDHDIFTTGIVRAVNIENGQPRILVNDTLYDMDRMISITPYTV